MRRFAGLAVGLGAVAVLGGCAVLQGIVAESLGMSAESKAVAYKPRSQELIATDGTYCFVSRGRFLDVEVGDHVLCAWSDEPRRDPGY